MKPKTKDYIYHITLDDATFEVIIQVIQKPKFFWTLRLRNVFNPISEFYLTMHQKNSVKITKEYENITNKELEKIVSHAFMVKPSIRTEDRKKIKQMGGNMHESGFGYFFVDEKVQLELGDDIVAKSKGQSKRRPTHINDQLVFKIMHKRHIEESIDDYVFWIVLSQKECQEPLNNYHKILYLEQELVASQTENRKMLKYIHNLQQEVINLKLNQQQLMDLFHQGSALSDQKTLAYEFAQLLLSLSKYKPGLDGKLDLVDATNMARKQNVLITSNEASQFVTSVAKMFLNANVNFDSVVNFKTQLLKLFNDFSTKEYPQVVNLVISFMMDLIYQQPPLTPKKYDKNVYIVVGDQDVGKSTLSMQLAHHMNGAIICASFLHNPDEANTYKMIADEHNISFFYGKYHDPLTMVKLGIDSLDDFSDIIIDTHSYRDNTLSKMLQFLQFQKYNVHIISAIPSSSAYKTVKSFHQRLISMLHHALQSSSSDDATSPQKELEDVNFGYVLTNAHRENTFCSIESIVSAGLVLYGISRGSQLDQYNDYDYSKVFNWIFAHDHQVKAYSLKQ